MARSDDEPPQLVLDDPEWLGQSRWHPKGSQSTVANELGTLGQLPHGTGPIRIVPSAMSSCRENASRVANLRQRKMSRREIH